MNATDLETRPPVSFGSRLGILAARHPDAIAVVFATADGSEHEITWAELEAASNRVARLIEQRGAGQDSRVIVALRNSPEHLFVTFGAWKLGATPLPLRSDLPQWERERLLAVADPSVVVADWPQPSPGTLTRGELERTTALSPDPLDVDRVPRYARLIATSGATGTPKIIATTRPGLFAEDDELPVLGDTRGKTSLVTSPLYHVNGFTFGAYTPLLQGARIVLMERFEAARAVELIERHRVAFAVMVPTMLQRIARLEGVRDRDLSSIERLIYGGASAAEWVIRAWLDLIPPERFFLSYGGTEGYGLVATTGDAWLAHPGTCGQPLGCDLRIVDSERRDLPTGEIGEILLRNHSSTPPFEYVGIPTPPPDPEGWGSFGDLGSLDPDGFLYIADRRQDMIVSGGANVFPAEVEAALSEHPGLADTVVIGLPDHEWGQRVHAIVEPADTARPPSTTELQDHCRVRLAAYKVPKTIELVDVIPRSSAGKVNRSALRAARTRE